LVNDSAGTGDTEWRAACDEAQAALSDALVWNLPASRWERVQEAVADMAAAVAAGRLDDLWQTTGRLELCSPVRVVTRLGDTPQLPAPKAVREQIAELIDALTGNGDRDAAADSGPAAGSTAATTGCRLPSRP